jgi:hypothetical protein
MQQRKRIALLLSVLILSTAVVVLLYLTAAPARHPNPQWRNLISHAQMLQVVLKLSSGTAETPVNWGWRAAVRHVEGSTAEGKISQIDERGIIVDSSQDIRSAGGVFAVVGSKHIVVLRDDKQLVVLEKEAFYSSMDKRGLLQGAEPW